MVDRSVADVVAVDGDGLRDVIGSRDWLHTRATTTIASAGHRALQQQEIFKYDTTQFPFRKLITELLINGVDAKNVDRLTKLHLSGVLGTLPFNPEASCRNEKKTLEKRYHARSELRDQFLSLYRRFVTEVVGKTVREQLPQTATLYVQHQPVLRIAPPSRNHIGKRHCDADYGHQQGQLNFWLPLVPVDGANTLWCESTPGLGDFAPFVCGYGECVRFYGNACRHYTMPNTTNTTRVSLDFRVVPDVAFEPDPDVSRKGGHPMFTVNPEHGGVRRGNGDDDFYYDKVDV
eukprot:m.24485 g.24485  ORF g.24485 m.24485 type:complete len:290 (-) comp14619_c0_seq1:93-962(-)